MAANQEVRLPLEATGAQLEDAIRQVQGRARTNVLDEPAAKAMVGVAMHQFVRVMAAAMALDMRASDLQPRGTWCQTARYGENGVHTVIGLSMVGWRVYRGSPETTRALGVVDLRIPALRGSARAWEGR